MPKRTRTLEDRIDELLKEDDVVTEASNLWEISNSLGRFYSKHDLAEYLTEGALLNIGKIGGHALSVPCGEYMVWLTGNGTTMLVPSSAPKPTGEVFEGIKDQYEIHTDVLLGNWNKVERSISESNFEENESENSHEDNLQHGNEGGNKGGVSQTIDASTVDRTPLLKAMEQQGIGVTELARLTDVDPPAISRILREPKSTAGGDPGGRNPSMGLAAKICSALRVDPTAAFPDIFTGSNKYDARDQPANTGSGMKNHAAGSTKMGAATKKWTQGSASMESLDRLSKLLAEEMGGMAGNIGQSSPVTNTLSQHGTVGPQDAERNKILKPGIEALDNSLDEIDDAANVGMEEVAEGEEAIQGMGQTVQGMQSVLDQLEASFQLG
jgi:hypothetical protein